MFIPNSFKFENEAEKIAFMKRYSFATIITAENNIPIATHLPFVVDDSSGKLLLISHLAIDNEQARLLGGNTSLVIFTEPHAYISPTHYDKKESVPTWDYIAVHAYGKAKLIEDEEGKERLLKQTINLYEKSYMQQWESLSEKFRKGMMRGIIGFELEVTDLQGQKKLSQNKKEHERERIVAHLENSGDCIEKDLAPYIKNV